MSQMTTYAPLSDQLRAYLSGQCALGALEEWLVENLQSILVTGNQPEVETANHLDALFIEKSEGLCDEHAIQSYIFKQLYPSRKQLELSQAAASNVMFVHNPEEGRHLFDRSTTISRHYQLSGGRR